MQLAFVLAGVAALAAVAVSSFPPAAFSKGSAMGSHNSIAKPSPESVKEVVAGTAEFTSSLYRAVTESSQAKDANVVMSPLSLAMVLSMVAGGAKGTTLKEIEELLNMPDKADLAASFGRIRQSLLAEGHSNSPTLLLANRLWAQAGIKVYPQFIKLTKTFYDAEPATAEFKEQPEKERATINSWVSDTTKGKIKDLLPKGSIDSTTVMVLANAIYFKGSWAKKFDPAKTKDGTFTLLFGKTVTVPFMKAEGRFCVAERQGFSVLELPYLRSKGDERDLVMSFLLPDDPGGLHALEGKLSADFLEDTFVSSPVREKGSVTVVLPKFKLDFTLSANEVLQKLGMKTAFTEQADFSNMFEAPPGVPVCVGVVAHKAFVEVNEEGTEAAAAAAATVVLRSLPMPVSFKADHPFLFMIRERTTNAVLFIGRVSDPSTESSSSN